MKKINLPLCLFVLLAGFFQTVSLNAQTNYDDTPVKGNFIGVYTPEQSYVKGNEVYNALSVRLASEWTVNGFTDQFTGGKPVFTTGGYEPDANLSALSPEIQLPSDIGNEKIILNVTERFKTESNYDYMYIKVSTDNGQTWHQIYRASGATDWRTNQLNLTKYSGKAIRLLFALQADGSMEGEGWEIETISIFVSGKKISKQRSANAGQIASLEILNIHTDDYPETMFVDFIPRNSMGDFVTGLDVHDFTSYDNMLQNSRCLELFLASHSLRQPVDIVFLMDNSGSMGNDQQIVARNLEALVDNLNLSGFDVRLGLVRFGQYTSNGLPVVEPNPQFPTSAFFYDTNDFINFWNTQNIESGWYEPSFLAMKTAAESPLIAFREYAEKVFVLITDECVSNGQNSSSVTQQDAINSLTAKGIRLFAITEPSQCFVNDFQPVCTQTNGEFYPRILTDFSDVFDNLVNSISGKYTLRYCPDAVMNPVNSTICIPFKLEVKTNTAVNAQTCYYVKPLPRLERESYTQALDGVAQYEYAPVILGVKVLDGNSVSSVDLYYRRLDGGVPPELVPFISTQMTRSGSSTNFYALLQSSKVQRFTIQYYFVAHFPDFPDVVSPVQTQDYFAWSFAVTPNDAPNIQNVNAPTSSVPCKEDITIRATVTDNVGGLAGNPTLYYQTTQAPNTYVPISMNPTGYPDEYTAVIPKAVMQSAGISYYIYATDNYQAQGWYGTPENPKRIEPDNFTLSTKDPMIISFVSTAEINIACDPNITNATVKAYFTNDCGQLQEAGSGTFIKGSSTNFRVYGDDPSTPYKDGFYQNEKIYFRVVYNGKEYLATTRIIPNMDYRKPYTTWLCYGFDGTGLPQIALSGNGTDIVANDDTPSSIDGTDFGIQSGPTPHTFTIHNRGCDMLFVSNVILSDVNFTMDVIDSLPMLIPIGGQASFGITYNANATSTAMVSVYNNSISPFNFNIRGEKSVSSTCNILIYPNPMTASDYGGFVSFDVAVNTLTSAAVYDINGILKQQVLQPTTLPAGRHTYYISKTGLTTGIYEVSVNLGGNICSGALTVQ